MTSLIKYDAARHALQQAVEIDEVKDIRDKAQAMAAYAKQANDTKLIEWATEIKVRAERKAGQMLAEMDKNRGAMGSGSNQHEVRSLDVTAPKLDDLGISKNQSSRWQKLAAIPEDQFEQAITAAKEVAGEVTTAAMLRIEKEIRKSTHQQDTSNIGKAQHKKESDVKPETPKPEAPINDESDEPEFDEASIMAEIAEDVDPEQILANAQKEIDRLEKIIATNDQLAEIKKLKDEIRLLKSRLDGLQVSLHERSNSVKYWKTKYEKLEKQVKAAGLEDF